MSIESRLKVVETKLEKPDDCPKYKDYNSAAWAWEVIVKSGKHASEVEIPDYVCPACGRVRPKVDMSKGNPDYGKWILQLHRNRSHWEEINEVETQTN